MALTPEQAAAAQAALDRGEPYQVVAGRYGYHGTDVGLATFMRDLRAQAGEPPIPEDTAYTPSEEVMREYKPAPTPIPQPPTPSPGEPALAPAPMPAAAPPPLKVKMHPIDVGMPDMGMPAYVPPAVLERGGLVYEYQRTPEAIARVQAARREEMERRVLGAHIRRVEREYPEYVERAKALEIEREQLKVATTLAGGEVGRETDILELVLPAKPAPELIERIERYGREATDIEKFIKEAEALPMAKAKFRELHYKRTVLGPPEKRDPLAMMITGFASPIAEFFGGAPSPMTVAIRGITGQKPLYAPEHEAAMKDPFYWVGAAGGEFLTMVGMGFAMKGAARGAKFVIQPSLKAMYRVMPPTAKAYVAVHPTISRMIGIGGKTVKVVPGVISKKPFMRYQATTEILFDVPRVETAMIGFEVRPAARWLMPKIFERAMPSKVRAKFYTFQAVRGAVKPRMIPSAVLDDIPKFFIKIIKKGDIIGLKAWEIKKKKALFAVAAIKTEKMILGGRPAIGFEPLTRELTRVKQVPIFFPIETPLAAITPAAGILTRMGVGVIPDVMKRGKPQPKVRFEVMPIEKVKPAYGVFTFPEFKEASMVATAIMSKAEQAQRTTTTQMASFQMPMTRLRPIRPIILGRAERRRAAKPRKLLPRSMFYYEYERPVKRLTLEMPEVDIKLGGKRPKKAKSASLGGNVLAQFMPRKRTRQRGKRRKKGRR